MSSKLCINQFRYASCHDVQDQRPKTVARAILLCCEYSRSCPPMSDFRLISDVPPSISMGLRHNLAHKVFLCEGFFSVCTWVRLQKQAYMRRTKSVPSRTFNFQEGKHNQSRTQPSTGWPRKRMPHMVVSCDMELGGGVLDRYTNLTCETWAVSVGKTLVTCVRQRCTHNSLGSCMAISF